MRILLIGGEGYVGSVLSDYLIKNKYEVISYDNLIYFKDKKNYKPSNHKNFKFVQGDIKDLVKINKLLENIDAVIILAGLVGDPITKQYPELSEQINYFYLKKLINFLKHKKLENVIFISTCSNYGYVDEKFLADENFKLSPKSSYANAKVKIEKYILSISDNDLFTPTILRFATAFGYSKRMRFDLTINEFTRDLYFKEKLVVYDELSWRPYCHVLDFSKLIVKVLEAKKEIVKFEIFNAGAEVNNATKKNIIEKISKFIKNNDVVYSNNGSDKRNYKVDFKKVNKVLNFKPDYLIEDGINEIIESISKNKVFYKKKLNFGNYKVEL